MNRNSLSVAIMVLLLTGAGVWFFLNFERVTEREEVGWQGAARRDPFLAATRLLERMGLSVRETRSVAEFDRLPPGATLLLARWRDAMRPRHVASVLSWVEAGGHLIVLAEPPRKQDLLLNALKVRRVDMRVRGPERPSDITLPHAPAAMRVAFGFGQSLQQGLENPRSRATCRVDDEEPSGTRFLHFARGKGGVTVLTSLAFADNDNIAKHDHAEFLWQLTRFAPASKTLLVAARLETPSLFNVLIERALPALALSVLLIAAWLWRRVPRFGPVKPDPAPVRRRLLDHLRASGRFYWQRRGADRLLAAARDACLRKLARSHPGLADLPRAERAGQLAVLTGVSAARVDAALHGGAADALQFTDAVGVLQQIEERLVRKIPG
jgi:hypothetical protein